MAQHNELGIQGEQLTVDYLINKGYAILARNYRFKHLEIDVIARIDEFIVFVEVKTRSKDFLGELSDLISRKKQKDIVKAANHYLETKEIDLESRFDVVLIIDNEIEQIEEAFYPLQ